MVEEYIKKYQEINNLKFSYYFNNETATFQEGFIGSTFLGITLKGETFIEEKKFVDAVIHWKEQLSLGQIAQPEEVGRLRSFSSLSIAEQSLFDPLIN